MTKTSRLVAAACLLALAVPAYSEEPSASDLRHIVIVGTNDIHGGIEPQKTPKGKLVGGMALFAGFVKAIRDGTKAKYGDKGGVLLLDAGDQFQGTLISNYNEGDLIFSTMIELGYDAVITGNHDYDFGPKGWLDDKVNDQNPDKNPRSVIEALQKKAEGTFPILSANTYLRSSIVDSQGHAIDVDPSNCAIKAKTSRRSIDWPQAKHPDFLKPYLIKNVAGVRVALIGIDNPSTPTTTTIENVSDLCFRDEFDAYNDIRRELNGKADVFVMIIHDGNSSNEFGLSKLVKRLGHTVDAVIAGHTHFLNHVVVDGVAALQSGSGGEKFSRIDLIYDADKKAVDLQNSKSYAGIEIAADECGDKNADFCQMKDGKLLIDGVEVTSDPDRQSDLQKAIQTRIEAERSKIDKDDFGRRKLGVADKDLKRDRISESALADALTDAFRSVSKADVAFMNTGGLRDNIPAGDVTYEELFAVVPFSNHGLVIGPMAWNKLKALLQRSIETCGEFGALMQSGLKVTFARHCEPNGAPVDHAAKLLHVETVGGEVLLDSDSGKEIAENHTFTVATLDFLATGGSGFSDFAGTPTITDLGILREVLTTELVTHNGHWTGLADGRWLQKDSSASAAPTPTDALQPNGQPSGEGVLAKPKAHRRSGR